MCGEGTIVTLINPGPETESERKHRYERFGLEVVSEKGTADDRNTQTTEAAAPTAREEAGDETLVMPETGAA